MPRLRQAALTKDLPQIECGSCLKKLPLRLTVGDEQAAVWLCARCNVPFVARCVEETLQENAQLIRLSDRSFDVSGQPPIGLSQRKQAAKLASRPIHASQEDKRRSERIDKSLVVPATKLGPGFVPVGEPFQIMVANLSNEGVALIHDGPIDTKFLAVEFSPTSTSPVQMIIKIKRQRELISPFFELGGQFHARLGSLVTD